MTEVEEAITQLEDIGGKLWLEGERLRCRLRTAGPESVRLLEILRRHKSEVATMLQRTEQVISPEGSDHCAHCGGARVCACPACNLRRTPDPAPCCMCQPVDHKAWLEETARQTCLHCGGKGTCDCITCGQFRSRMEWKAGPCLSCEARKRQFVQ